MKEVSFCKSAASAEVILKGHSKKNTDQKLNIMIKYSDITETVYNSLTSLSDTNEFYEGIKYEFDIELSTLTDVILGNIDSENIENINLEIGRYIISLI